MTNFLLIGDALKRNAYKYSVKPAIKEGALAVTLEPYEIGTYLVTFAS